MPPETETNVEETESETPPESPKPESEKPEGSGEGEKPKPPATLDEALKLIAGLTQQNDDLRSRNTKLTNEIIQKRKDAKAAKDELARAKSSDQSQRVEELETENADLKQRLLVQTVARKLDVPDDLLEFLEGKGDDEKTLTQSAERLMGVRGLTPRNVNADGRKRGAANTGTAFDAAYKQHQQAGTANF